MPDYKTMYLELFHAITKAVAILQQSQIECERLYLDTDETPLWELELVEYVRQAN